MFWLRDPVLGDVEAGRSGRLVQLLFRDLLSVYSRYGLQARGVAQRLFPSRAPAASLPPPSFRLLPGGPVPARELHPLKSGAFHGALLRQLALPTSSSSPSFHELAR